MELSDSGHLSYCPSSPRGPTSHRSYLIVVKESRGWVRSAKLTRLWIAAWFRSAKNSCRIYRFRKIRFFNRVLRLERARRA
jgi:hypothetical protein